MKYTCLDNSRVDIFLTCELKMPRNQLSALIKKVGVKVNQSLIKKPSFKLQSGDVVEVIIPKVEQKEALYDIDFDIKILYEDEDLLIINKPPNIVVHPAPSVKEATVVDWLKKQNISLSTLSGEERHGIVHRLDKQTSGVLAIAKTNKAHKSLSNQLEKKSMGRYYLAIINLPLKENCIVDKPIGRNPKNRLKMGIVSQGRASKSAFLKLVQSQKNSYELIAAKLFSGRTHQIRVHLESISRSILGDDLYGFKSQKATIPRVMLHAHALYLKHPTTNEDIFIKAPLFSDFEDIMYRYFERSLCEKTIFKSNYLEFFSPADEWVCKLA